MGGRTYKDDGPHQHPCGLPDGPEKSVVVAIADILKVAAELKSPAPVIVQAQHHELDGALCPPKTRC